MTRRVRLVSLLLAIPLLAWGAATMVARVRYDPAPWRADYAHLKRHMEVAYANLEWIAQLRGVDLAELDRETAAAIDAAASDRGARRALTAFVAAFDDGHLRIDGGPPAPVAWLLDRFGGDESEAEPAPSFPTDTPGADVCAALGYGERDHAFEWNAAALPGWAPLPDDGAFPAGTFTLPDGGRAGLLRIGHFGEDGYRDACAAAWEAEAEQRSGPCDSTCLDAFRRRASDVLARRVADRARALDAAGARALVLDLTGNGGGSGWADAVARVLTDRPLRGMRVTFVRHPHWRAFLVEDREAVLDALADSALPPATRATLEEARRRLDAAIAEVDRPCDRSAVWSGREPGCRQTVETPMYATGVLPLAGPGDLAGVPDPGAFFAPLARDLPTGAWRGPLAVLVDGGSASATEQFVALLADNGAATVLGERTMGAGCGYVGGGIPATLPNSGLVVRMPDCARLRADGTNEIAGVEPDVDLGWSDLDDAGRARALVEAVAALDAR